MSMSDLQINYTEFHQDLDRYVSLLPNCYTRSCPHKLQNVRIIPEILMPYDPAFRNDLELVVRKFFVIQELLAAISQYVRKFVEPHYREWFDGQNSKLQWLMMLVKMSMAAQKLSGGSVQSVSVLTAGVGGINASVRGTINGSTLTRLRDLLEGIKEAAEYH